VVCNGKREKPNLVIFISFLIRNSKYETVSFRSMVWVACVYGL